MYHIHQLSSDVKKEDASRKFHDRLDRDLKGETAATFSCLISFVLSTSRGLV